MERPGIDPLTAGLAEGDERAYAELYDRFAGRLYRTALGMLGRREDAEDVMQEVFMGILQSRHRLVDVEDLTAYVFTALRRAAGRCASRRAQSTALHEAAAKALPAAAGSQDRYSPCSERLDRALLSLPAEQREVISLKIDGELTFAQIAQVIGASANTAASRYRYALEKLRTALEASK
jgi:RNA polymerase sigma-70 factor (ECF subfamily)